MSTFVPWSAKPHGQEKIVDIAKTLGIGRSMVYNVLKEGKISAIFRKL
jgi:hypothetical protein